MSEFRQRVEAAIPALRRYARALTRDSETADEEVLSDSAGSQAAPVSADGTQPKDPKQKDQGAETSVNGRVTTTGW